MRGCHKKLCYPAAILLHKSVVRPILGVQRANTLRRVRPAGVQKKRRQVACDGCVLRGGGRGRAVPLPSPTFPSFTPRPTRVPP